MYFELNCDNIFPKKIVYNDQCGKKYELVIITPLLLLYNAM